MWPAFGDSQGMRMGKRPSREQSCSHRSSCLLKSRCYQNTALIHMYTLCFFIQTRHSTRLPRIDQAFSTCPVRATGLSADGYDERKRAGLGESSGVYISVWLMDLICRWLARLEQLWIDVWFLSHCMRGPVLGVFCSPWLGWFLSAAAVRGFSLSAGSALAWLFASVGLGSVACSW